VQYAETEVNYSMQQSIDLLKNDEKSLAKSLINFCKMGKGALEDEGGLKNLK
jgi:hypothetical protein